jgi:uncharacterized protein
MVMSKIVVFGAGGRAGRRAIAEAVSRGHHVTAAVRDPARHAALAREVVTVVAGDVTDADSVAAVSAGHDAVIAAVYRPDVPAGDFYVAGARALLDGLAQAGVRRLVVVGIGTLLETSAGFRFMDQPGQPPSWTEFSLGRVAELETLRAAGTDVDWLVIAAPPTPLDERSPRSGRYQIGGIALPAGWEGAEQFSYADLLAAVVDEIEAPMHHRTLVAVTY